MMKTIEVANLLDVSKQKMNYWKKHEIKPFKPAEKNWMIPLFKKFVNSRKIKLQVKWLVEK